MEGKELKAKKSRIGEEEIGSGKRTTGIISVWIVVGRGTRPMMRDM